MTTVDIDKLTTIELLSYLRGLGLKLWLDGERLRFTAPKGALSPEQQARLSERKSELIGYLRKVGGSKDTIARAARDRPLPASFAQQRLWFLDQLEPGNAAYNLGTAIRLVGRLDWVALRRSIDAIVQRHEALRTTFASLDGEPIQVIASSARLMLPVLDLRQLPKPLRERAAWPLATDEARQPFDLAHGPLLRVSLFMLGSDEQIMIATMHHIVSDGWSLDVFVRELKTLYTAHVSGVAPRLPELPIQYADYAVWQRQWLHGEGDHRESPLQIQLAYWRRSLAAPLPVLDLPTDYPRPPAQRFHGATQEFELPAPLPGALEMLSQRAGCTLFMTLFAAFVALIARYTGQDDILVGTPVAGRPRTELEGLIGFFVNTLVLRADLSSNPRFAELLERVRATCLGAYAHQALPFEHLVEALQPQRDLSRNPLFQVMFVLQNAPQPLLDLPNLSLQAVPLATGTALFDWWCSIEPGPDGLSGAFQYNTDLFDAATIARLLRHFLTLLQDIATGDDRRLWDLSLLSDAERTQLLTEWNDTTTGDRQQGTWDRTIHALFEAQAARTPDAVALVFDGEVTNDERRTARVQESGVRGQDSAGPVPDPWLLTPGLCYLTYAELNRRANQLAQHLRGLGVGPEARVGICVERSLEIVIGLLGILKAGGAYLPLDPAYPPERLAFMLEDSQAKVLVTQRALGDGRWTIDDSAQSETDIVYRLSSIVYLDAAWPTIARQPVTAPDSGARPDHLAYMIYTSGSTGTPKGVLITHHAIVNRLLWMQGAYQLTPDDRVLQKTPFSFDVSVWEFFWPLLSGACLVVARPQGHKDAAYLVSLIAAQRITTLHFVPSMLQVFLDESRLEQLHDLRRVVCSGEALPYETQERYFMRLDAALYNLYGPTEAAVDVTAWLCAPGPERRSIPIGRPVANTQIYILDRAGNPAPIGVPGELYIGGVQLARGYHNRPDLTAERFVPNPFATTNDQRPTTNDEQPMAGCRLPTADCRLYKTGDLTRYRADGAIEYLGRIDDQVKLRGFRIELGEIAATLRQHPAVRECAVVARQQGPGDTQLVAYVVPAIDRRLMTDDRRLTIDDGRHSELSSIVDGPSSLVNELRNFLKERLPDYMLPAHVVLLDALPLMPNGKLAVRELPAPERPHPAPGTSFAAPHTPIEAALARIWASLLSVETISIHDNFFALGGHSLLGIRLLARMRDTFQVELPLRDLFRAPTLASLARAIEKQHGDRSSLSALPIAAAPRELRRAPSADPAGVVTAREMAYVFRASFAQQRLWFLDQLEPANTAYNMSIAVRLTGRLDRAVFRRCLDALIARHETLRTSFTTAQGQLVQLIAPSLRLAVPMIDLQDLLPTTRETTEIRLAADLAQRPFDLARAPLLRCALLWLNTGEYLMLLVLHHIIADGWSLQVLMRDLGSFYAAFVNGSSPSLPELTIQYADYAEWQQQVLHQSVLEDQLAYWRQRLAGAPKSLDLPADRPRPSVHTFGGADRPFSLPYSLGAGLTALSQRAGVTLFMTLLAAFQTLLARYSGQDDIVVGSPVDNRSHTQLEGVIGLFVNTLVLRTDLSGNPTFQEILRRVYEVALGAYDHQNLPFEQLVEALQPERDLSRNPLFQVLFAFQQPYIHPSTLPDLELQPLTVTSETARFDLALSLADTIGGMQGSLEYNTALFDAATIDRMLRHFRTLLEAVATAPDLRFADVPLLSEAERRQILVEWNDTESGFRGRRSGVSAIASESWCLHCLFETQATRSPDVVAVVFQMANDVRCPEGAQTNDESEPSSFVIRHSSILQMTYAELNMRANQLAHHLRALGVGPEVRVALYLDRSLELLVGMLGVLKAGGAYVPLDPSYPAERISFILEDSGAAIVLTNDGPRRPEGTRNDERLAFVVRHSSFVNLAADWPAIARQPTTEPDGGATADNLAYLIYTSGSTGQPKGVLVDQGGVVNILKAVRVVPGLDASDVLLAVTTIAFDIAALELLLPLTAGARVILAEREIAADGAKLSKCLSDHHVTLLQATPTTWRMLLDAGWSASGSRMWCGGEALSSEVAARLLAGHGPLWNLYGPTETTIWSTISPLGAGTDPSIGRPIANTQAYVLDRYLNPVPVGVVGELYIGGAGVARGYHNRPDLTATAFVPNPFADERRTTNDEGIVSSFVIRHSSFVRLYKTGDLARYQATGELEYLGRRDLQVKLRGYRIELGEVEAALARHPHVREAVVLAREDAIPTSGDPDKRLVAYVVPDDERRTTEDRRLKIQDSDSDASAALSSILNPLSSELRSFLAARLPAYMIPAAFVLLDTLPHTPNGKVDRRALPAPAREHMADQTGYYTPRSPTEELLVGLWATLLQLDRVGILDNFFGLGGHSLLATQLITRVGELFHVEIPLRVLFERPCVADFAAYVDAARTAQGARVAPIEPAGSAEALPLSYPQQRLWSSSRTRSSSPLDNVPLVQRLSGRLDVMALRHSLNVVIQRHETLRATFSIVHERPAQIIAPSLSIALPVVDLRAIALSECEALALRLFTAASRRPFDLEQGPLIAALLLRLGDEEHILAVTIHHIVFDGWSIGVLMRELIESYMARVAKRPARLPDLPIQYADFACWQRRQFQGPSLEQHLAYWRQQLADAPPALELPIDYPRPSIRSFRGARHDMALSASLTGALKALSRSEGATLFMTLLAAFQVLLSQITSQHDVLVGSPIANRTRAETEGLIGFFANMLALRGDLRGNPTFRNVLGHVRAVTLEAYDHQEVPFELLIEMLWPEQKPEYHELFQVSFVLQNAPMPAVELLGLTIHPLAADLGTSAFDLTLIMTETETGLSGTLEYSTDLFEAGTIARISNQFQSLLQQIVADPDQPVGALASR